ncbi:hypothetical protein GCM10027592_08090 [Spirosoma flavus]
MTALQLAQIPLNNETIKQHLDTELGRAKKSKSIEEVATVIESFTAYIERHNHQSEDERLSERIAP